MKKLIVTAVMILVVNSFALAGIGIHFGVDNTSVSAQELDVIDITMAGVNYNYSLNRDAIKSPYVFGGQIYFDIPVVPIGFEVGLEGAWATYKWRGSNKLVGPGGEEIELRFSGYEYPVDEYAEEFDFAKINVDVTAKWYIFSLPPVVKTFKFYVGGGAGFHYITPIVSDELIRTELEAKYAEVPSMSNSEITFDVDEYMEKFAAFGFHGVAGVQLKLPALPIAFNVDYKYTVTDANDYGDPTNEFGVVKGSFSLYF